MTLHADYISTIALIATSDQICDRNPWTSKIRNLREVERVLLQGQKRVLGNAHKRNQSDLKIGLCSVIRGRYGYGV